ncbi:hypothetical protein H6P81_002597 [Aristolochia fimbriata]|uniref:Glycosyltransferase N-terminal domain-containing protein n=1 Tax=Aristolochia fimbriata TaxID=158543 RepID=A0AAV7FBW3_ARIFI|nr:hypothetical protein H6P81_002597 [Aristolochia fimbriata]
MGKPHAVVVPFPAQGHVLPLMELSRRLVDRGIRVTVVCSEFDRARMIAALRNKTRGHDDDQGMMIHEIFIATVPDGLEAEEEYDRGEVGSLCRPNLLSGDHQVSESSSFVYPEAFLARLGTGGKIVSWAPQQKVLAHPAIGCFVSHCGWNSTTEGLSNGVPFLCWPYFGDQILNKKYVCEVWRIGVELEADEDGIITCEVIQKKVQDLLRDEGLKRL